MLYECTPDNLNAKVDWVTQSLQIKFVQLKNVFPSSFISKLLVILYSDDSVNPFLGGSIQCRSNE